MKKRFYGKGIPNVDPAELKGTLIVIEGPDGSGRSTQSKLLKDWLGRLGYPTTEIGLKRSRLVHDELDQAMKGNTLSPLTMSLFYATDFADQIEHELLPALRAGFVAVADRYIYTLMVRDIVRGADPDWIREVYGFAPVPDIGFYLSVPPATLAERSFRKSGVLDYWESGMDIQRIGGAYESFIDYQRQAALEFEKMVVTYHLHVLAGDREPLAVQHDMQTRLHQFLSAQRGNAGRGPLSVKSFRHGKSAG